MREMCLVGKPRFGGAVGPVYGAGLSKRHGSGAKTAGPGVLLRGKARAFSKPALELTNAQAQAPGQLGYAYFAAALFDKIYGCENLGVDIARPYIHFGEALREYPGCIFKVPAVTKIVEKGDVDDPEFGIVLITDMFFDRTGIGTENPSARRGI